MNEVEMVKAEVKSWGEVGGKSGDEIEVGAFKA